MNHVRTQQQAADAPLEKGQIWILKGQQLEVKHVGKHLVEFMLTRKPLPLPVQRHIRVAKQLVICSSMDPRLPGPHPPRRDDADRAARTFLSAHK